MAVGEGTERGLSWDGQDLGKIGSGEPGVEREKIAQLLRDNAWRFLSVGQVEMLLKALWGRRPDLHRAYKEVGVELSTTTRVLQGILGKGHPIKALESLIESITHNRLLYSRSDVLDAVLTDMTKVLGWTDSTTSSRRKSPGKTNSRYRTRSFEEIVADDIRLEIGRGLLHLVDPKKGETLTERVASTRESFVQEYGWIVPGVQFADNLSLDLTVFRILVRGVECFRGSLELNRILAMGPLHKISRFRGVETVDPVFSVPARWVHPAHKETCDEMGCLTFSLEERGRHRFHRNGLGQCSQIL